MSVHQYVELCCQLGSVIVNIAFWNVYFDDIARWLWWPFATVNATYWSIHIEGE